VAETKSVPVAVGAVPDPDDIDKLTKPAPMAAKEPVGQTNADVEHLEKLRDDALTALTRLAARDIKFANRLERRHAVSDPLGTASRQDVAEREQERLRAQLKAAAEADERAAEWVAPDAVKGRTDKVFLRLQPPVEQRKMTIQVRALGEIDDGFIMIFEDPPAPDDPKLGRVAESERFGTKNKVRVEEIDRQTGKTKGEISYLGYKDFGPLRMNAGDYVAVVVDMDDGVLAQENFSIVPDYDLDNKSDQVYGVRAPSRTGKKSGKTPREQSLEKAEKRGEQPTGPASSEPERAALQEEQVARTTAKSAGEDMPPPPETDTKPVESKELKAATADTPEARATKGS